MIPYLLAAAFCIALGYLLRMLSEEDRPPERGPQLHGAPRADGRGRLVEEEPGWTWDTVRTHG